MKIYYAVVAVLICLVCFGTFYYESDWNFFAEDKINTIDTSQKSIAKEPKSNDTDTAINTDSNKFDKGTNSDEDTLVVYITGEVKKTGIYEVKEGARLYELIEQAGGLTKKADTESVNLARFIFDGEQIHIYASDIIDDNKDEIIGASQKNQSKVVSRKVSINSGSLQELCALRGIGESRAQDIIDYRKKNGPFKKLEDIMQVKGIKQASFDKIKDDIIL